MYTYERGNSNPSAVALTNEVHYSQQTKSERKTRISLAAAEFGVIRRVARQLVIHFGFKLAAAFPAESWVNSTVDRLKSFALCHH
jgi:hypothetical protein